MQKKLSDLNSKIRSLFKEKDNVVVFLMFIIAIATISIGISLGSIVISKEMDTKTTNLDLYERFAEGIRNKTLDEIIEQKPENAIIEIEENNKKLIIANSNGYYYLEVTIQDDLTLFEQKVNESKVFLNHFLYVFYSVVIGLFITLAVGSIGTYIKKK